MKLLLKGVSESLSGRIGLITLPGFLCVRDMIFLMTRRFFPRRNTSPDESNRDAIHRGRIPELCENPDFDWQLFYSAYVRTYIKRDVGDLSGVRDSAKFTRFMIAAAASGSSLSTTCK